jgi:subtilisin family serine protease
VSEVITVAAIGAHDPGLDDVESLSMQGPAPVFFPSMTFRPKPDLAAFDGVVTTLPSGGPYNPFFGTSAAAPHSAAVAALLLSNNPTLSPAQVQNILTSTALDIEAPGFDNLAGHGRIDALAAINAVAAPTTTTTMPGIATTTMPSGSSTTTSTPPLPSAASSNSRPGSSARTPARPRPCAKASTRRSRSSASG